MIKFFPTVLLVLSLVSCSQSPDAAGREYANLGELTKAQEEIGFVVLGKFGNHWPAEITEVKTAENEISFSTGDGVNQSYPGYFGYTLKVIKLKDENDNETIIVFRSKERN